MRKTLLTIIISLFILAIALTIAVINYPKPVPVACTADAKICPDGSSVGRNPDNGCEFYDCPSVEKVFCNESQRNVFCTREYIPVCGFFDSEQIQCVKEPCGQTYGNKCDACSDEKVLYWEEGECSE